MKEKKEYISISLKKKDFKGQETDVKIDDLLEYENLKSCNLFHFLIDERASDIMYGLSNLKFIYFDFCYFSLDKLYLNENIEELNFNLCENLKIQHLRNTTVKRIKIIQLKAANISVNLSELEYAPNLEEISIHNCKVKGIEKILEKASNIKKINLDGSIVENQSCLMELSKSIEITNKENFYYANA